MNNLNKRFYFTINTKTEEVFNINNDDKVEISHIEEVPTSIAREERFPKDMIPDFNEDQLFQILKNYIDCNTDGME